MQAEAQTSKWGRRRGQARWHGVGGTSPLPEFKQLHHQTINGKGGETPEQQQQQELAVDDDDGDSTLKHKFTPPASASVAELLLIIIVEAPKLNQCSSSE